MREAQGKSHSEGCGIFSWKSLYFFSPYVSQADLCRLGRDYIGAGKYTDMVFPSLGCRFIALNDGVDTIHKNNEMLVILKNMMNDLYARDTSNKIRAVKRSPFKTGKYVECYAPIGCRKSAEDKRVLEKRRTGTM